MQNAREREDSSLESKWRSVQLPSSLSAFRTNGYFADTEPSSAPQDAFAAVLTASHGDMADGSSTKAVQKRKQSGSEITLLLSTFLQTMAQIYKENNNAVVAFHNAKYDVRAIAALIWSQPPAFAAKNKVGITAFKSVRFMCTLDMAWNILEPEVSTLEALVRSFVDPLWKQLHTAIDDTVMLRRFFIAVSLEHTKDVDRYLQRNLFTFQQIACLPRNLSDDVEVWLIGNSEQLPKPIVQIGRKNGRYLFHTRNCTDLRDLSIRAVFHLVPCPKQRSSNCYECARCNRQGDSARAGNGPLTGVAVKTSKSIPPVVHISAECATLKRTKAENLYEVDISDAGWRGCKVCWVPVRTGLQSGEEF